MNTRPPAPDFVGRRAELAVFERAIADARVGLPSVVLVGGDVGIGKTTIVSESAARAGVGLYLGRSTHIGGDSIPLAPLADLLRRVRRSKPDLLSGTPALEALHHWFAPRTAAAPLNGAWHGGLFVAVLELFSYLAADEAIVVGFEDLHWADTVTWDLFGYLARNLIDERVVLVGTYRANEVAVSPTRRGRLAELTRLPAARRLHLEGLDRDEIAQRVAMLLGAPAPGSLVDKVLARGRGNPFFTGELVAAHQSGETIPIVLSDLISAEIADLDDRARLVLGAIATIGRETSHELLTEVMDLPDHELEGALRVVIAARLLEVDNDAYRFRHPLFGEVVYADMLPPQRARLHRSVAATLARQPAVPRVPGRGPHRVCVAFVRRGSARGQTLLEVARAQPARAHRMRPCSTLQEGAPVCAHAAADTIHNGCRGRVRFVCCVPGYVDRRVGIPGRDDHRRVGLVGRPDRAFRAAGDVSARRIRRGTVR